MKTALPLIFESLRGPSASPPPPWLDRTDVMAPFLTRMAIHEVLGRLQADIRSAAPGTEGLAGGTLHFPETRPLPGDFGELEARVPFIVKSNAACGVSFSHKMVSPSAESWRERKGISTVIRLNEFFTWLTSPPDSPHTKKNAIRLLSGGLTGRSSRRGWRRVSAGTGIWWCRRIRLTAGAS